MFLRREIDENYHSSVTKKKIYLIDLGTGTDRSLLPLSCGLIKSFAMSVPDLASNVDIDILMLQTDLDDVIKQIEDPFLVGISCYCWNFLGSVAISERIKKEKNCPIVWGGSQIPLDPVQAQELMQKHSCVDVLVHGEGEITFSDLVCRLIHSSELENCSGITFRNGNSVTTTGKRERIKDLSSIPSPYLNGIFDEVFKKYRSIIVGALWETNRGCPFSCSFCDWGNALVNKVNYFDIERVKQEIEWVSRNNIHYVYATDANYGIKANRDLDIAKFIVKQSKNFGFPNTLVLNWTKNSHESIINIAEVLLRGGIITNVTLSHQSLNNRVLNAINRKNIKPDYLVRLKDEFHGKSIPTYSELILGLPEETFDSFIDGLEKSIGVNIHDQTMIYLCCVLSNTQLYKDKDKYEIETRTCSVGLNRRVFKYDRFGEDEMVVSTSTMSLSEWKELYEISFLFMALYNLKVAYFIMVFLNVKFNVKFLDFIRFIIGKSEHYNRIHQSILHIRNNRQLILDNCSSVSSPNGAEGVCFTPHEAAVFLLLSCPDETYCELRDLFRDFLIEHNLHVDEDIFEDICKYQELSIPRFNNNIITHKFNTTAPIFINKITHKQKTEDIQLIPTVLSFKCPKHDYDSEVEFNRRRVSCGYSINLNEVCNVESSKLFGSSA